MEKVVIIGSYPPPLGGISVHIKRIKAFFEKNNLEVVVYNCARSFSDNENKIFNIPEGKRFFLCDIFFIKGDIFYFHTIEKKTRMLLSFYKLFGKKIILYLHGESMNDQLTSANFFEKQLLLLSLKSVDYIICANSEDKIKNDLVGFGINPDKIESIPAYVRPDITEDINIPEEVSKFIEQSDFLISANGWVKFYNNQDLYGIDLLIDLIYKLNQNNINASLVFALLGKDLQEEKEKKYYQELKNKIIELNIQDKFLIFESENTEFYPILAKSKLFIRPTNTDAVSISIYEAFDCKVPCIVSNVCPRPKGAILFESRNLQDLYDKTVEVINNYNHYKDTVMNIPEQNFASRILEILKKKGHLE